MSYRDFLDQQSEQFVKRSTNLKHLNKQVNGETQMNQEKIKILSDARTRRLP